MKQRNKVKAVCDGATGASGVRKVKSGGATDGARASDA